MSRFVPNVNFSEAPEHGGRRKEGLKGTMMGIPPPSALVLSAIRGGQKCKREAKNI